MPSIVATINVKPDKVEEAKAFFKKLVAGIQENEPGTLSYIPHQSKDEPTKFIFYEKYADGAALAAHGANLAKVGKEFASVMAGPPEIVQLEEI